MMSVQQPFQGRFTTFGGMPADQQGMQSVSVRPHGHSCLESMKPILGALNGLKTLQYALSTCFKSAGCQSKMSSKPNLIDIMPYAAASS